MFEYLKKLWIGIKCPLLKVKKVFELELTNKK